jgi:RNA-directed DNA polymerase
VGELTRQDYLLFQKLRAWSRHRTGDWYKARKKYWTTMGNKNWVFATRQGDANPLRLLTHTEFGSSGSEYVKVKSEDSPFNGNLVYWSIRAGKNPIMPTRKAILLKGQKGICPWCCLHFREGDTLEVDHILATALGGKDEYKNLQLLHGHCHDEKTTLDMDYIRKHQITNRLKLIHKEMDKTNWFWDENDILITSLSKVKCPTDKGRYIE